MVYEHSAGAVIFRKENGQLLYLLLHYEEGHWGCSKGHTEKAETNQETARREIREETGLTDIRFIPGFQEDNQYIFMHKGEKINKTVTFLLAETHSTLITISNEHIDSAWLPYQQALERITFKSEKAMFIKAHEFVNQQ
jgi:8-oxo-dGTP pyrophosphatase MutT (NUDIX family)